MINTATTEYKRKPKYASARVVQTQIDHWAASKPEVLRCRSVWHSWEDYTSVDNGKELAEVLRCKRCHGHKYRVLNSRTGAIVKGWQTLLHPDYYMPAGGGRISGTGMNYVRKAALDTYKTDAIKGEGNIYELVHIAIEDDTNA